MIAEQLQLQERRTRKIWQSCVRKVTRLRPTDYNAAAGKTHSGEDVVDFLQSVDFPIRSSTSSYSLILVVSFCTVSRRPRTLPLITYWHSIFSCTQEEHERRWPLHCRWHELEEDNRKLFASHQGDQLLPCFSVFGTNHRRLHR